jgi:hypothetical protein
MSPEILWLAIFEALEYMEDDALASFRKLGLASKEGGDSRDSLQVPSLGAHYAPVWKSAEASRAAMEDPRVLRCWSKLASEIRLYGSP